MTGAENAKTKNHSLKLRGAIPNILANIGIQRITKCAPIEAAIANNKYGLTSGLILNNDSSSEIAFKAFNISITTRTDRDSVDAFTFPIVKYKQGLLCKSTPSIKLTGWKLSFGQDGHYPQLDN